MKTHLESDKAGLQSQFQVSPSRSRTRGLFCCHRQGCDTRKARCLFNLWPPTLVLSLLEHLYVLPCQIFAIKFIFTHTLSKHFFYNTNIKTSFFSELVDRYVFVPTPWAAQGRWRADPKQRRMKTQELSSTSFLLSSHFRQFLQMHPLWVLCFCTPRLGPDPAAEPPWSSLSWTPQQLFHRMPLRQLSLRLCLLVPLHLRPQRSAVPGQEQPRQPAIPRGQGGPEQVPVQRKEHCNLHAHRHQPDQRGHGDVLLFSWGQEVRRSEVEFWGSSAAGRFVHWDLVMC